ncbi:MAG: polysulfide reductase NrfD [Elusimicrobia bacterium]|nr:polysulfide reductase NrfD [Elusimicrobiota bacterium]
MKRKGWAFYVQVCGLLAFYAFTLAVNGWFLWRIQKLRDLGDNWMAGAVIGCLVGPLFILFSAVLTFLFYTVAVKEKKAGVTEPVPISKTESALIAPILNPPGKGFLLFVGILVSVSLWALFAWSQQVFRGLQVTGLGNPVFWGFYITNFVFFIGISHAGTLISAILRIANAEWRRPITRSAEVITVMVLFFGAANILLDLGRPDRMLNVFLYGRYESPLLWDVCSITAYLTASSIYLYIPLIPDIAILRDHVQGWRRDFYELLSLGWTGAPEEVRILEKCIAIMAIVVIPVAISVHTVVSYVFSMTVQPMWHSTIFGPYFVVGAIFSGIAALIIAMAVLRKAYGLQEYLRPIHFQYLGTLLLVMSCLWLYFTFCEYITVWYGHEPDHMLIFFSKLSGRYSFHFWTMALTCFVFPFLVLASRLGKTVGGTVAASAFVCVGMWLERFLIVVPTLVRPRLPYTVGSYSPSWVEISLFAGCLAAFALLYTVFTRLFPIVSIWEVREGKEHAEEEVSERIRTYFPAS